MESIRAIRNHWRPPFLPGFAVPAEVVIAVIGELQAHGHVDRGYFGVSTQALTPALAKALGAADAEGGVLVNAVDPDGPSLGSLFVGDVLTSINGTRVAAQNLGRILGGLRPGASADVAVLRDGARQSVTVRIGQLPDPPLDAAHGGQKDVWVPALDLAVANTTATIRLALKAEERSGLIVTQLRPAGAGAMAQLQVGDLITHYGLKRLTDVADVAAIRAPSADAPLLLRVVRGGSASFVAITGTDQP